LKNKTVQLRLSILDSSATGNVVYQETHSVTTDSKGLFSVSIGGGTPVLGSFSQVAWAAGAKFLQTDMDTALSGVFLSLGSTELKSVPYALYAQSALQATSAQTANSAQSAISAQYSSKSDSSKFSNTAGSAQTANSAQSAISAQYSSKSDSSNFSNTAGSAQTATSSLRSDSSTFSNTAGSAQTATTATSSQRSDSSTFSTTSQAWVRMSTTQRDALTNIPAGTVIFNTTTGCPNYYNGSTWFQQCGSCSPEPSQANAGPDVLNATATSITLQATAPAVGAGTWTVLYGSGGTLTNDSTPNATFTGVAGTIYTLRYTVSNGCGSTSDDMNVSFSSGGGSGCSPQPSQANAGPDASNLCGVATLNANVPTVGTGQWSKISGSGGSFANSSSASTTFTGTAGETYVLRWTITNACGSTADELTLVFVGAPTTANAGLDQTNVTTQFAALNGNAPTVGSGQWTIVAGVGGSLSGASTRNATFTGTPTQTYTLRWTITNACGTTTFDDVQITFGSTGGTPCTPLPTSANAGPDSASFCPGSLLYANSAFVGTGQWSVVSGTSFYFTDISQHNSAFYGSSGQTYTLRWTITTPCGQSSDEVVVTVPGTVNTANADQLQANIITIDTAYTLSANAPNAGCVGTWSVISGVAGTFSNINDPKATYRGFNNTSSTLKWTISNACGVQSSDTVRIDFRLSLACGGQTNFTDPRDGQVYPLVGIGTQCWMAKNMNIGTMIPSANGDQTNNQVIEKYCYNDNLTNCTTYGGLYQWAEAVQYQNGGTNVTSPNPAFSGNIRGLCPAGWHLPSDAEWTTLENTLGGTNTAGIALKSTNLWYSSVGTQGTNSSGFNALPGGYRGTGGTFYNIGYVTFFWSSSESSSTNAFNRNLYYYNSNIGRDNGFKYGGFSARCTQD
jgi:uncharacterized protein (TIGR02145 family)